MASRIWFYNHWGELEDGGHEVTTTPRGWVLNGYGRCDFAINLADSLCSERLLRFGNFVRIVHYPNEDESRTEYGILPEWVGMIVPPRTWNKDAVVVSAVSAEALLAYRAVPFVSVSGPPDVVFRQIIASATSAALVQNNSIPLRCGRVDNGAEALVSRLLNISLSGVDTGAQGIFSDELRTNAYDHIKKMISAMGMDWDVTAEISPESGALRLLANLYTKKGRPGYRVLTTINTDDQNPLLTEQGTIINDIFAYNQAQTEQTRIMQEIVLQTSVDQYGPLQTNVVFSGITDSAGMLAAAAQARVNARSEPVKIVKRTALDYLDTFSWLRPGNNVFVYDSKVGFNADGSIGFRSYARILSADFSDLTNKVALNVELIPPIAEFPEPESFFV